MKKIVILSIAAAAALALSVPSYAQIDPTVTVTRNYEGTLADAEKPMLEMFVPDTVTRFDIQFEYTVKPKTFEGSYEFSPYLLDLRPEAANDPCKQLFVKVGAGYSLRPTAKVIWSPQFEKFKRFSMNVYATHDSYYGKYRRIGYVTDPSLKTFGKIADTKAEKYTGYDLYTNVGTDGRFEFPDWFFAYDAGYLGIHTRSSVLTKGYNSGYVSAHFAAKDRPVKTLIWDASVKYSFGRHNLDYTGMYAPMRYTDSSLPAPGSCADLGKKPINENNLNIHSFLGSGLESRQKLLIDVDFNLSHYDGVYYPYDDVMTKLFAGNIAFTPRYVFNNNRLFLSVGLRFDVPFSTPDVPVNKTRGNIVYPHIKFNWAAIPKSLDIYANLLGGVNHNAASDVLQSNHFFSPYSKIGNAFALDNTVEQANLNIGFRGEIAYRFRYDLSAGFISYANAPLDACTLVNPVYDAESVVTSYDEFVPGMVFAGYNMYYFNFDWGVMTETVNVDGFVRWQDSDIFKNNMPAFEAPRFSAGVRGEYNWRKRVYAGITLEGAIGRRGKMVDRIDFGVPEGEAPAWYGVATTIPGYVNLSIDGRYKINRTLSVWLEGSNLCNQVIQRTPFYAERGIDVRAGIIYNF